MPPTEERTNRFRTDFVIAVFALLISGLTAGAGLWQTHVVGQQLSSAVWPYVHLSSSASDKRLTLQIVNDGLGPAIIENFVVSVDGRRQRSIVSTLHQLVGRIESRKDTQTELDLSIVHPGGVIRASSEITLLHIVNARIVPQLVVQAHRRMTIRLCYCSIVGNCWQLDNALADDGGRPKSIAQCPPESGDSLRPPTEQELDPKTL